MRKFGKLILGKAGCVDSKNADFAKDFAGIFDKTHSSITQILCQSLFCKILQKSLRRLRRCQPMWQNLPQTILQRFLQSFLCAHFKPHFKRFFTKNVVVLLASFASLTHIAFATESKTSPCFTQAQDFADISQNILASSRDFILPHSITPDSTYIFGNSKHIIVPKSQEFVSTLASEVFKKSGIKLFIDVIDEVSIPSCFPTKESRKAYQNQVLSQLKAPFVIIFLFVQEHKIEILSSADLHYATSDISTNASKESSKKEFLSPKKLDSIYFDYMAPLLPHKEEDFTPNRISGVILNGYAEIADRIADTHNFRLENNFPRDEEGVRNYVKFILYAMLFILLGLFAFAYLPRKNKS